MTDRKGNNVAVGDRVFVLPSRKNERDGGHGYVRRIKKDDRTKSDKCRIDDGPADMGDTLSASPDQQWSWSAWCSSAEIEKL